MNAKKAKAIRKALNGLGITEQKTTFHVPSMMVPDPKFPFDPSKAKVFPAFSYESPVNHNRRIRRLAKSVGGLQKAIEVYKAEKLHRIPADVYVRGELPTPLSKNAKAA